MSSILRLHAVWRRYHNAPARHAAAHDQDDQAYSQRAPAEFDASKTRYGRASEAQVIVGGVPITSRSRQQWADAMVEDWHNNKYREAVPKFITSANGHVLSLYARDRHFRTLIDQADAIDADGMSLILASRWLTGSPLPGRVATTDFFHDAARAATEYGISFFFLGSTEVENRQAVCNVRRRYPKLRIAGRHHGYFQVEHEEQVVKQIVGGKTDVLWVGLGVPREHAFISRNLENLRGLSWAKSCGGLFNFLSGTRKRAPSWMQEYGLEWMYRMIKEPKRLFWRYVSTSGHAMYLMLRHTASPKQDELDRRGERRVVPAGAGASRTVSGLKRRR